MTDRRQLAREVLFTQPMEDWGYNPSTDTVVNAMIAFADRERALSTPPTDAGSTTPASEGLLGHREDCGCAVCRAEALGSTTREGGEGKREAIARIIAPEDWAERDAAKAKRAGWWPSLDESLAAADRILATTPSPAASPDSGEAEDAAIALLDEVHRALSTKGIHGRHFALNAIRATLAASPASLSGGAEEVAAELLDHYADFIRRDVKADDLERHPYLPLIEQTAADLRKPSPEAPANRQEAGEVAIWSGEHRAYWRRGSRGEGANYTLNLDEAGIWTREEAAKLTSHCGPEKLIALHDRPTLTSPKDVKGGER